VEGFSPGFTGRPRAQSQGLPPGQYVTESFPVLSAGATPRPSPTDWELTVRTETGTVSRWSWSEFLELPAEHVTCDIHCVTSWSKLGTSWRGVSVDTLLDGTDTSAGFVMARSYGGYTTNLPLGDLLGGKAWVATEFDGRPLEPEHGGPARLLVPHLYFWKSAKWLTGLDLLVSDSQGFWERNGYHRRGDPLLEQRYS